MVCGLGDGYSHILIIKGLIGGLFNLALFGAFLIIPAGLIPGGTWYWPRVIFFLAVYGFILEITMVVLAIIAPASLKARLKTPVSKEQPLADRIITTFMMLLFPAWVAFIPVDVFYLKILPGPHIAISICGAVIFLFGYVLIMVTIYQNSFAIPVVEDSPNIIRY